MDHGTLALLVPVMGMGIAYFAIWTKHQRRLAEMQARNGQNASAQIAADTAQRIAALEDRVRVLERIATSPGASLASEIEALRDIAPPPPLVGTATPATRSYAP